MLTDNRLTQQIEEYITYKQSLGFLIRVESQELRRFAAYTREMDYTQSLTAELAITWASLDKNYSRWYMARRLETLHTFAVYIAAFDAESQIPPNRVFGRCHTRITPYIYTEKETLLLMAKAKKLYSPDGLRQLTVETALGLLWATGLRVSELTSLKVKDVMIESSYLFIHHSKFKKERLVVLDSSVTQKLGDYKQSITKKLKGRQSDDAFFVTTSGKPFTTRAFEYAFQLIRPCLNVQPTINISRRPRLYDFRHTFACRTIKRWLEQNENVNQKLYLLSTYMGHTKPKETYWYLSATPELLAIASEKYEDLFGKRSDDNEN